MSRLRVKQAPPHGADLVEAAKDATCSGRVECTGMNQQAKVAGDLLRGAIRDSPVVQDTCDEGDGYPGGFDGLAVDDDSLFVNEPEVITTRSETTACG